jgi:hypothetical protein
MPSSFRRVQQVSVNVPLELPSVAPALPGPSSEVAGAGLRSGTHALFDQPVSQQRRIMEFIQLHHFRSVIAAVMPATTVGKPTVEPSVTENQQYIRTTDLCCRERKAKWGIMTVSTTELKYQHCQHKVTLR